MSAIINIFDSAFTDEHRKIKVEAGLKIEEVDSLDWENTLIYVNGFERKKGYRVRDNDVVTIRQFPSDQGSGGANTAQVLGWMFMPVTSAIHYFSTGSTEGALLGIGHAIDNAIRNAFSQTPTDTNEVGQGEKIPTVSGAKNRSGANQSIPLLLGETMYTPITLSQVYTDIDPSDGTDGENQYLHALYCLGYKNIDVKSVALGIYKLSLDEHNGTSGSLNCGNSEKKVVTRDRTLAGDWIGVAGFVIIPVNFDGVEIQSVNRIVSYSLTAEYGSHINAIMSTAGTSYLIPCSITSVTINNGNIFVQTNAPSWFYVRIKGQIVVNCTTKDVYSTLHYLKDDVVESGVVKKKGYKQQLELRQDNNEVSLYPQKVVQENSGTELMHPEGVDPLIVTPFSAKYPQKIQLEVMFQNLVHFDDDGTQLTTEVEICAGYSLDGGVSFSPFSAFTPSSSAISVTNEGTVSDALGTYRVTKFRGCKNKAMRFIAEKTFTFNEVFNIPEGTVKCKNNVIEFRIWRKGEDVSVTDSKYQYKCFFSSIRTWCYDYKATLEQYEEQGTQSLVIQRPIIEKYRNMTARLGFKIRAGDEISGTIKELNVLMESRARYCTITESNGEKTFTWSGTGQSNPYALAYTKPTSNPASLALMVLQHEMRGEFAYTDDNIDLVSFGKFYEWCEQTDTTLINAGGRKFTANGVVSRPTKTIDLVNQILNCGHGKLVINGNKYGVLFDKPDETPVMILNNQNVLEAKNTKNFLEDIDGYSCKFIDSLNDYQEDTQIFVPTDLDKDPSEYKLESIELPWITDVKRAYRMCMYMLACRKTRPETWERKLGVDGNLIDVGSLVTVQDDTIVVGIGDGAQITEVNEENGDIVSIEVDYGFTVTDTTKTYGVTIQHADALGGVKVRTYELAPFSTTGTKTTLVFAEPIDSETVIKPNENDVVSFGIYDKVTTDAIVLSKKSNNDGTFTFVLVPYQDDLYLSEYGVIPEFQSNVTSPTDAGVEVSEELPPVTLDQVGEVAEAVINEGTDTPPSAPTNLVAVADEIGIQLKWTPVANNGINNVIKHYVIEKSTDSGTTWAELGTTFNSDYMYVFRRTGEGAEGYPESSVFATWRFRIKAVNVYGYSSTYLMSDVDVSDYGTWIVPNFTVQTEVVDRTAILTAVYIGTVPPKIYGHNKLKVWISREGNKDTEGGRTFNQILGVTPDIENENRIWYTPEFSQSVMPSDTEDTEKNYHHFKEVSGELVADTEPFESDSYKVSHTLPLIGQCPRLYNGNTYVTFACNAEDTAEVPLNPQTNDVIHYTGTTGTLESGKYYIYLNDSWVELIYKKPTIVPTEYYYKVTISNESGSSKTVNDTSILALCTNIADIVHSHEHYKDLYVEKLSAINANIGMISQGGMGSFEDMLNCWALSDLSAEDSGVLGGVKKGTFRVGGLNEYFRVTPQGNGKYKIELRAGNIELTTDVDGQNAMDFQSGTYIYNNDKTARLQLSAEGITAQKQIVSDIEPVGTENPADLGWYVLVNGKYERTTDTTVVQGRNYYMLKWENVTKVYSDEKGNMIITNADNDKVPPFGFTVTGTIYHLDDPMNPLAEEVAEGVTPSNPQGLSATGTLKATTEDMFVYKDCSPYFLEGSISKDVSSFTGNIVLMTKSAQIITSGKAINLDGTVENVPTPLTGYNDAMRQDSTEVPTETLGAYLGLSQQQVQKGIFY